MLTLNTSLIVRDVLVASEESVFLPLTFGIMKCRQIATTHPVAPTTQKGIPKPPALYKADPITGPETVKRIKSSLRAK